MLFVAVSKVEFTSLLSLNMIQDSWRHDSNGH